MSNPSIQRCPMCNSIISEREVGLYRELIITLWNVYKWCIDKNVHEFSRKDIKHLFSSENDTARFGDLVYFGGLVYKKGKANYGLNMERCDQFFKNAYKIPLRVWKNPITKETTPECYVTLSEIPTILSRLDEDMLYVIMYR